MQYTTLGQTELKVSRLCFGTMSFGGDADKGMSAKMFHRCCEVGINFFDCANIYSKGTAEGILGELIRGRRDELVITSKVGSPMDEAGTGKGSAPDNIRAQLDNSLLRLGTDRLDVYFCHCFDRTVPMEETLNTMDEVIRQGKVRHFGVSNWAAWQIARGLGISELRRLTKISVIQPMYSLAKRTAEIEMLPMAQTEGLGVIPYSPLGAGLLTGKYSTTRRDQDGRLSINPGYASRYAASEGYAIAERFCAYADTAGIPPATLAVAWVKAHPAVTAPIIGARNTDQLEASLAAGDYRMSDEQWHEISQLTAPVPLATDRSEERPAKPSSKQ